MFKNAFVITVVVAIIGIIGTFGFNVYSQLYLTPSDSPKGSYEFKVKTGDDLNNIADKLAQDKVVNSAQGLTIQARLSPISPLQSGSYKLELPAKPEEILRQIDKQSADKVVELENLKKRPSAKITFIEGENLDQMIAKLVKNEIVSQSEMEDFAKDKANFDKNKYPFLPDALSCTYGDAKTCAKYYIEGYLYPDTYTFFKPSPPKEVFDKFLDNFNIRVWSKLKDQAEGKDFYKIMTMASVLEKETGRPAKGVSEANLAEVNQERKTMVGVFLNRTEKKIKWSSDVTAEYGTGKKLCQQTFKIENCMFLDSPLTDTKFNTYRVLGYPIGPVTNPQYFNVEAALNPEKNDFIYFVSDGTGKKYFTKTDAEFQKSIRDISKINRGLGL